MWVGKKRTAIHLTKAKEICTDINKEKDQDGV